MYNQVMSAVDYLKQHVSNVPKVCVVLGSGLGAFVDAIEHKQSVAYKDIPNFPVSTVEGHDGQLVFGQLKGVEVVAMQGRFHYYEGYTMQQVTFPVFVMKMLGVEKIVITNACGGINLDFQPGTLMLIKDFINLMGSNPLMGVNDARFGPRFPDMTEPYKLDWIAQAKDLADQLGIGYKEGIYAGFPGPYYETAAEIVMIGRHGADAVGMSTVPETIAANYLGMEVLGIACITNMATGIQKQKHSHAHVLEVAKKASIDFSRWLTVIVEKC